MAVRQHDQGAALRRNETLMMLLTYTQHARKCAGGLRSQILHLGSQPTVRPKSGPDATAELADDVAHAWARGKQSAEFGGGEHASA